MHVTAAAAGRAVEDIALRDPALAVGLRRNSRSLYDVSKEASGLAGQMGGRTRRAPSRERRPISRRLSRSATFGAVSSGEWPEPLYTCEPLALHADLLAQQGTVALSDHLLAVGAAKQ